MSQKDRTPVTMPLRRPGGMRRGMGGHGGPMPGMMGEKPKNFKGTLKRLISVMGEYKLSLIVVAIFAIGSAALAIFGPKVLGNATNEIVNGFISKQKGGAGINFERLGSILLWLLGLYVISAAFDSAQGFIMSGITQKLTYKLRKQLSEKIHRMPMKYFDKMTRGEVLSRMTNDIDGLSMSINQSVTQVISSVTTLIGIIVMMFSINWIMTLTALLILPLSGILMSVIIKKSQKHFKTQQEYLGHCNGQIEEVYGGHNIVKAFNAEERAVEEFDKANKVLYNSAWKAQFFSGLSMPITAFIGNLSYVAIAILGSYLVLRGRLNIGSIQSFFQYVRRFNQPVSQVAQMTNMLQSTVASAERVFEFLDEEEEPHRIENAVSASEIQGVVEFKNVRFGYDPDKIIIKDFSTRVDKGQRIAIVGPTGAGKTTIIKLLMRFYDVNDGAILVDGHDIREYDRSELRRQFGMVLQDTWLFNGTIMENIRYGKLDATDEEVIEAAKAAYAHNFIKTLPDGYNMVLNEEASNVSQGQKQLLTIARAILANPKILILDEATSSVDTRTELRIQKAMNTLMQGRTSFIIAHRLSTIRDADKILVMNDGDIVEQGKHEELLAKGGFYAKLYYSQFEQSEAV